MRQTTVAPCHLPRSAKRNTTRPTEFFRCGSWPAANATRLRVCHRRPSRHSEQPSPRAAFSTATSAITSGIVEFQAMKIPDARVATPTRRPSPAACGSVARARWPAVDRAGQPVTKNRALVEMIGFTAHFPSVPRSDDRWVKLRKVRHVALSERGVFCFGGT